MRRVLSKHWPLVISLAAMWLTVAVLTIVIGNRTAWHQFYTLDDPYIHMAMSKNFARHGVWGITAQNFTSSSSSILWALLLALVFKLGGEFVVTPLALNLLVASVLLAVTYFILRRYLSNKTYICALMIGLSFIAPIPALIFDGMEHVLQILINIVLVTFAARVLSRPRLDSLWSEDNRFDIIVLLCVTPLVPMIRYEGLFLIAPIGLLLLLRRRFILALSVGALAMLPVALYGVVSVAHGWSWLPNSVFLKGTAPNLASLAGFLTFFQRPYYLILAVPSLMALSLAAITLYFYRLRQGKDVWEFGQILLTVWAVALIPHLFLAATGAFYRYEAYLVAIGFLIVGMLSAEIYRNSSHKKYVVIAMILVSLPLCFRAEQSLLLTPRAATNIYEQQYQMALFLRENYSGAVVAANDIGAINFLADIDCIDLFGLATWDVAAAKKSAKYDTGRIDEITASRHCRIAIVYDSWFDPYGGLPRSWVRVGRWFIPDNVICGDSNISIYAVDPAEAELLQHNLDAFSVRLPKSVTHFSRIEKLNAMNVSK